MTATRRVQVCVTLPEPLYLQWKARVEGLNLSAMLEEVLERRLKEIH